METRMNEGKDKDIDIDNFNFKKETITIIDKIYLSSIYLLLSVSIWYFVRLLIFDRKIAVPMLELYHFLVLIALFIAIIAFYRYYKVKIKYRVLSVILRLFFLFYAIASVTSIISNTYIDISPSVKHKWESGEWTF